MALLSRLFGPSREEVWRELCQQIGADFVDGGFWKGDKVEVHHKEWTITLDTYTVHAGHTHVVYTRIRAPFVNRDGFRFTVYRKSLFSGLGKALGMQDIEVGHSLHFDEDFIIKGNDDARVKAFFANDEIRRLIAEQPKVKLEIVDDDGTFGRRFPEGVDQLRFEAIGVIKDVERLKSLYDLFAETLDELHRLGSAAPQDPGVAL